MRILSPVTRSGHSSAHVDCIKRGSGWHPFRVLLASSNDHISSSPPFENPTSSKNFFFSGTLLYFSSTAFLFVYLCALINACLVWCQPSCMNLVLYFIPYSSFFGPSLASADNIPHQSSCTVQYFFLPSPSDPFCSLMLVVSWSLLLLLSTFLFTAASVHLTVWATMRKTWENSSRGICYVPPFRVFLHIVLLS